MATGASVATFLSLSIPAFADSAGVNTSITLSPPAQALGDIPLNNIPQFLITLLFIVGIIIAVVFLIYGGIKWILSGGDSKQVEGARSHIVAAIVGLIIVVGAFVILNIVFTILTGKPFHFGQLCIPSLTQPNCGV